MMKKATTTPDPAVASEEAQMEIRHDSLPGKAFPVMLQLREDNQFCDVKLIAGNESFQAHRIVLAASIPYFHSMFTAPMKEATLQEIVLNEIDSEALGLVINFAYSGRLTVNTENVERVIIVASFLQVNSVRDGCAEFLKKRISAENVIGIRNFVETLNCTSLVTHADKYVHKYFSQVSHSDEFLQIGITDLVKLLSKDELVVDSEEEVYNAMIRWIKQDLELRSIHLPLLLKTVRLPLVTPEFLADTIAVEPIIRNSFECRDLLDEVRNYFLLPDRRHGFNTFKANPRAVDDEGYIYVIGSMASVARPGIAPCNHHGLPTSGCTFCDSMSTMEVLDPSKMRWRMADCAKMVIRRSRVGVCFVKRRLYAVGGFNGLERLDTVEAFDFVNRKWVTTSPMAFSRSAVGCCAINNKLFVCGGYDGHSSLHHVECYNPDTDKWNTLTPMLKHRSAAGVAGLDGNIYSVGGHDGTQIFNSVERYDPIQGTWSFVAPMKSTRCRLGTAALNGKLYACGGYNGTAFLRTMEVYDPVTNEWKQLSPMFQMRSRVVLVTNGGKLFAIARVTNLSSTEVYDPKTDSWTFIPNMYHQGGVGAATVAI